MSEAWKSCPLFREYKKTKSRYIRLLETNEWKRAQKDELWNAILATFDRIYEPAREYWMQRLYSFYCSRFSRGLQCSWLVFLGELTDEGAYGKYQTDKARRYCCMVRDTAYRMTHMTDANVKACEPVYIYEYYRVAA